MFRSLRYLGVAVALCGLSGAVCAQVIFYGGDQDWGGIASERNTQVSDARIYDDFDLVQPTVVDGLWCNSFMTGVLHKHIYYEIRQGVSEGNGGSLLASGTVDARVMLTGRTDFGLLEYHTRASIPSILLPAGKYWMTLAIVGFGRGRSFACEVDRPSDRGPVGDPNPPVTGSPIDNGNSFFDSPFFNADFIRADDVFGGAIDFSYGVGTLTTAARWFSLADRVQATRGVLLFGGPPETWASDDARVIVEQRYPFNAGGASAQIVVETFAPGPSTGALTLTLETSSSGLPTDSVLHRVEMYDFAALAWIVVDERTATQVDRVLTLAAPSNPGRFSEPITFRQAVRISWLDRGVFNLRWKVFLDHALWQGRP